MPLVVYWLGMVIFTLATSEFMVAGMMPSLAKAFQVSVPQVGNLISLYALGVIIGGPFLTISLLRLRIPNKTALLGLLALYASAQLIGAITTQYSIMAMARFITGVASAACFGASFAISAERVAVEQRGRAASILLSGLMLAAALGVPMATVIDQQLGWRISFGGVALLTLVCALVIAVIVPLTSAFEVSLRRELSEFANRHLWAAYTTSALILGATFAAFSFFTPILTHVTGVSSASIPWLLCSYGVANIVGNAVVGRYADRHTFKVMALGLTLLAMALVIFALWAQRPLIGITMLIGVGLVGVTLNPAMVARIMQTAQPGALINTVHSAVINVGIALGTWLAGMGLDRGYGWRAPLWTGAVLAIIGLLSLVPYLRRDSGQCFGRR